MDTARLRPTGPGWPAKGRPARGLAAPLLAGALLALLNPPAAAAGDAPAPGADIELRKSFTRGGGRGRQPSRDGLVGHAGGAAPEPAETAGTAPPAPRQDAGVAHALGEPLASSGALHLPLPGGATVVLAGDTTPVLESATGRRVIIDAAGAIDAQTVAAIERAWPGYVVARPEGVGLRELIASVLDVAGYASVDTARPLVFGRGATVRVTPDFLIQRRSEDLLHGEVRAVSVVDAADGLPGELRELAAQHRVRIVDLAADGRPVGNDVAPWRDPTGRITIMDTPRLAALLAEIAAALGAGADLVGGPVRDDATAGGAPADPVRDAVGALLSRLGLAAVGPVVEFYRPSPAGSRGRFAIAVPGWLAERDGRRLLITGAALPVPVRLYLTREGIDLFEYRFRSGTELNAAPPPEP